MRLGLLNIIDGEINGYNYESFKTHPYVQSRVALFNSFGKPFKVDIDKKVASVYKGILHKTTKYGLPTY